MSRRRASCHPDRPHCARGLCKYCHQVAWRREKKRREWERLRRPCALCADVFTPSRRKAKYCSDECQRLAGDFARAERRYSGSEERIGTRSREHVMRIVRTARGRGCVRVDPNRSGSSITGPYYSAWHRGRGLYVIRVRWPAEEEEAA